jgi:hypothetical protein
VCSVTPSCHLVSHGLSRHNALRRCRSTKATPRVQVRQTSSRNVTQAIYEGLPEGEPFQLEFPPRNFTESLVQRLYFDPSYAGDLTTRFRRGFVYDTQFTVSDLLLFLDKTPFPFSLPQLFRPPIDRGESQRQTSSSHSLSSSSPSL